MQEDIILQPKTGPVNAVIVDELDPSRWILGANSKIVYEIINPTGSWLNNLVTGERQNIGVETWGCTNHWGLSDFEIQLDYMIEHNMLSTRALAFLHGANCANISYFDKNGKINFSDKFTFIKTGTKYQRGNYVYKTPDSVRNDGAIPEAMLPHGNPKTWNEYADPSQITELMEQLGHEFAEIFEAQYETIVIAGHTKTEVEVMIEKHLKQAPLSLAIAVCPGYMTDDPIKACNQVPVHCVGLVHKEESFRAIFDSYPEYVKHLDNEYLLPYLLKAIIIEKNKPNTTTMKAIKTEDSPHIYLLSNDGKSKMMILDMPTYEALGVEFEIVTKEELDAIPTKGTMSWIEREILE